MPDRIIHWATRGRFDPGVKREGAIYTLLIDSTTWSPTGYPAGWEKVI